MYSEEENQLVDLNKKCCTNCKWYCKRTGFCRKFPPQVVMQYINRTAFPTAAFPKVSVPDIDWCSYFENKLKKK